MNTRFVSASAAIIVSAFVLPLVASAQNPTTTPTPGATNSGKTGGKMSGGSMQNNKTSKAKGGTSGSKMAMGPVYVCQMCHTYMSEAAAKKVGYKDPMGHKLTKMVKAPAGYKMGNMSGNMGTVKSNTRIKVGTGTGSSAPNAGGTQ